MHCYVDMMNDEEYLNPGYQWRWFSTMIAATSSWRVCKSLSFFYEDTAQYKIEGPYHNGKADADDLYSLLEAKDCLFSLPNLPTLSRFSQSKARRSSGVPTNLQWKG